MEASSRNKLFFSISVTMLIIAIIYYSFYIGRDIAEHQSPLVSSAMEIKLEVTTAHLWFEEVINGDQTINIEDIWAHLDKAQWYAQAMLIGGTNKDGNIPKLTEPNLRLKIEETITKINYFRQLAQKRWVLKSTSGIGSQLEKRFDLAFLKLVLSVDTVENDVKAVITKKLQTFKFIQLLLITLIIMLGVVTTSLFLQYNTRQLKNINDLKISEENIYKSQNLLLNVINAAKLGYWDWYYKTGENIVNDEWLSMLGLSRKDITNHISDWEKRVHPEDKDKITKVVQMHILSGKNYVTEFRMKHVNGTWIWIQGSGSVVEYDENTQKPIRLSGTHQDITERKIAEDKLKLAASVFTHARESIAITDAKGTIIDLNETFTHATGYSREEIIGQAHSIVHSDRHPPEFYTDIWETLAKEGHWYGELWNRRKNGDVYAEIKTISAVCDEQGITTNYVVLGNDITAMKEHQKQLELIANYDILTNLPNRSLLADRLSQAMLQCNRHGQSLAVVFLDLDGFKHINDTYGHNVGDNLLIAISILMKNALREGDSLARIGGDEFVAVLTDLTATEDYEPILERLLRAASEPVTIDDIVVNVSASIGVTLYPQDNVDADLLLRHADQAMYVAKESGKNHYHLFDTAQDDAVKVQRESLEAIRSALDNQQFVLYYQPKVNMRTGMVIGVEALIRWQHPERGLIYPLEFLPVIENNPMSIEVGEWVINTALAQISQWQKMGLNYPLSTSVNIAAMQLQQPEFTQRLAALLSTHSNIAPKYLTLEVLETNALNDVQHVSKIMKDCIALGVNFALDDFGTGYSSLTYLRRLPASLIKIDQSFVRDMLHDADDLAIIEGVIALSKSFNRDVIAEGVETIEHGASLLELGCDLAQGYGIARPMPANEIPQWINNWKPDTSWKS